MTRISTAPQLARRARHRATRQQARTYARDYRAGLAQAAQDYPRGWHAIPETASAGYQAGYARGYRTA